MRTALDVAKWFIAWAEVEDAEVSNLKLQKLLYYAQGHFQGQNGVSLFEGTIQAWKHGPVVPEVYHEMKSYGQAPIEPDDFIGEDGFPWEDYRDVERFLIDVWDRYAIYSAWALRNKTHEESPWRDAFTGEQGVEIGDVALKDYFSRLDISLG